jgi:hypothetical protein
LVLTIDCTLLCYGGLADSYGAASALGIALCAAFAVAVVARLRGYAWFVLAYGVTCGASLLAVGASTESIWGPSSCGLGL